MTMRLKSWRRGMGWWVVRTGAVLVVGSGLAIWIARERIGAMGDRIHEVGTVPACEVGLVLGCSPTLRDGRENWYFRNRMDRAAEVYRAGRVERLLVSGDHSRVDYDEPTAMKAALVERGVPAERIVMDQAGFSTLDSVVRAREVFGQEKLLIISQRDHVMRAVYIAEAHGMEAVGVAAAAVGFGRGWKTDLREGLARVRAVWDVTVWNRRPRMAGPSIGMGMGSGAEQ